MQKALVVLATIALIVLVAAFVMMRKREALAVGRGSAANSATDGGPAGGSSEIAQLRKELETRKKGEEAQRKRAEAAEQKLAELAAASTVADGPETKKPAAKKTDWKTRRDAELEAKVKSMEWRKHANSIMEFWKANEKARADGRQLQFTPELQLALSALQADMIELYKFMGMEGGNSQEVFQNAVVAEAYMDSLLQELTGGSLSEDQLAKLRSSALYQNDMDDWDFTSGNILERWKELVQHNQSYTSVAEKVMSPDQLSQLSSAVTPTFMLSIYAGYSEKPIAASGAQAAPAVTDFWMKSFKLPDDQRAAVEAAAAEFVRRQAEIASLYPGARTRETEFEILLKTIEAQIAAEQMIAQSVHVDPELAKKLLKGSGAVLRLSN